MIANDDQVVVETTMGPKLVPKKYVKITQNKLETVTIKTKDGKSIPLLLKSLPVVFKNPRNEEDNRTRKKITIQKLESIHFDRKIMHLDDKKMAKKNQRKPIRGKKSRNNFVCEQCGKGFPNENKYKFHLKYHNDASRTCNVCQKLFKYPTTLQKHMLIHTGLKYSCNICSLTFASKPVLEAHARRHNGEYTHKCEECGKEYYNAKSYNHHMEAEHFGIRYPCEICGSVLKSKRYYKDHMANHSNKDPKTFECNVCHKYYSTKSALNGHMRIHTGQRYICHICGKKSIQKGAHNGHMRMHAGEKSYICELCGKDFLRKDVLDQHMRRIHETSKKPCNKCEQIFLTDHQLMVHLHTHSDIEKPYPCELCDEKFIDKNFLRNHVNKVHIEQKVAPKDKVVYFCEICRHNFENVDEFKQHVLGHECSYEDIEEAVGFDYKLEEEETPYANHEVVVEELITF